VPTSDELNRLAEDFKTFLLGVMLRVLARDPSARVVPPGQYQFTIGRGDVRRMGNERAFRLNGLPPNFRLQIQEAVQDKLDTLNQTQMAAMAALALAYSTDVYKPKRVPDETGFERDSRGFASAIAGQLADDLKDRARRKGATDGELQRIEKVCYEDRLEQWTDVIPDSDADAYGWEVQESDQPRLKRVVKTEFFGAGWLEANVLATPVGARATAFSATTGPGVVPPAPGMPPPLPGVTPQFQYYLAIQGQQSGPHPFAHLQHWISAGQLPASTLAWREGLTEWIAVKQIPELAPLFTSAAPPPLPGGGPPPMPGSGTTK
jgi:hypothetical protein